MKQDSLRLGKVESHVASRAEAWIETYSESYFTVYIIVASRAEAWIETVVKRLELVASFVASRAEAWIETLMRQAKHCPHGSRLPRGGVD